MMSLMRYSDRNDEWRLLFIRIIVFTTKQSSAMNDALNLTSIISLYLDHMIHRHK